MGGIFNNRSLFSLLFSGNFCGGQGFDGRGQRRDRENPAMWIRFCVVLVRRYDLLS